MRYEKFYKTRHAQAGGYGRTGHKHAKLVVDAISGHGVRTVLDWGAGSGSLASAIRTMRPDFSVHKYDPCVPGIDTPPMEQFDAVVSTDVLEHIPYEELGDAIDEIVDLTRIVGYHYIANYPARESMPDGTNLHVVQENCAFWRTQFESAGVRVVEARDVPITTAGRVLYRYVAIKFVKGLQ